MDYRGASFEIKAVNTSQRLIEGHAAVFGNLDKAGDVIDPVAFDRTLREKPPADVAVFVGHQHNQLPIGEALELRPDLKGLFSKTYVLPGPVGDQLLEAARKGLVGLSIGYVTRDSRKEKLEGKTVRRLLDLDLVEYSFASRTTIANPEALVTSVKQEAAMPWRVEKRGEKWCVLKESDGSQVACHADEAGAHAQMRALYANEGKTADDLPDSAFAFIESGGQLDAEGKTVPRSLRHFPHHAADGSPDRAAVLTAINAAHGSEHAARALPALLRHAAGAEDADDPVWVAGVPAELLLITHDLTRLAERAASQQKAMAELGHETKAGWATGATLRQDVRAVLGRLQAVVERADGADTGTDATALAEWWRMQLALLEV